MHHPEVNLAGKTALVTGGSRGLGEAAALGLASRGASVVVVSRRVAEGEVVAEKIRAMGGKAAALACDVTDEESVDRATTAVLDAFGAVDVLVNSAGINIRKPALELSASDWDAVLATNLKGVFLTSRRVGEAMAARGRGKIVNMASMFGLVGFPMLAAYCASKGGVIQLTRTLALEWADRNVQVNAVAPGYIKTPLNAEWLSDEARLRSILGMVPMGRLGRVEDVVGPILFLASEWSDYVTGAVIPIDGGWTAR